MELKVVCQCGQKFKFDVEPVNGQMPFAVNCPACNADGTAAANALLAAAPPAVSAPPPPIAPTAGGLRINLPPPQATATNAPPPLAPPPISGLRPAVANKKTKPQVTGEFSLVRGILGALLGAGVGCGLMFGFWLWAHFRFPLMGIAVGAAAGYGARWLARGTDNHARHHHGHHCRCVRHWDLCGDVWRLRRFQYYFNRHLRRRRLPGRFRVVNFVPAQPELVSVATSGSVRQTKRKRPARSTAASRKSPWQSPKMCPSARSSRRGGGR